MSRPAVPAWARPVFGEVLVVGATASAVLMSDPTGYPWAFPVALVACATLPLRLRWPGLSMLACLPGLAGGLGWPPAVVALYRIGRGARSATAVTAWVAAAVLFVTVPLHLVLDLRWQQAVMSLAFTVLSVGASAALGALVRVRRELTANMAELRRARAAEVDARLERARADERSRIAREIHDAVGHHATLIAVQAAALAATTQDPATRQTAQRLRELAKESLGEMRAALGLLNSAQTPARGLADLPELLNRARQAGLNIEFAGDPWSDAVVPQVSRAVYRVVQEALTNAARHAPASDVHVQLTLHHDRLRVAVTNGPPGHPVQRHDRAGGAGLEGLAERVRSAGGTLYTQTKPHGGFRVFAELPVTGPAPPTKVGSVGSTFDGIADPVHDP